MLDKVKKYKKYLPTRKALAGGLTGIAVFAVTSIFPDLAVDTAEQLVAALVAAIGAMGIVPESQQDLIKKADKTIKAVEEKHGESIDKVLKKLDTIEDIKEID